MALLGHSELKYDLWARVTEDNFDKYYIFL